MVFGDWMQRFLLPEGRSERLAYFDLEAGDAYLETEWQWPGPDHVDAPPVTPEMRKRLIEGALAREPLVPGDPELEPRIAIRGGTLVFPRENAEKRQFHSGVEDPLERVAFLNHGWDGETFYMLARIGDTMGVVDMEDDRNFRRFDLVAVDATETGLVTVYTHRLDLVEAFAAWREKVEATPSDHSMLYRFYRAPGDRIGLKDGVFSYTLYETSGEVRLEDFSERYVVDTRLVPRTWHWLASDTSAQDEAGAKVE